MDKKKPGRPRKSAESKPEQFSIRLSPKLKFGLELLARAQGRSLSQAIEWAVQVGLNGFRVNNDWDSVAKLMEDAWSKPPGFDRVWTVFKAAPTLIDFDDRSGCELVEGSLEFRLASERSEVLQYLPEPRNNKQVIEEREIARKWIAIRTEILFRFTRAMWGRIRDIAVQRANIGQLPSGASLMQMLDIDISGRSDLFARMQAYAELAEGKLPTDDDVVDRMIEIDRELPWGKIIKRGRK